MFNKNYVTKEHSIDFFNYTPRTITRNIALHTSETYKRHRHKHHRDHDVMAGLA